MAWYLNAWSRYADFQGRALRSHYWFFVLFNLIFLFVLGFLDGMLGLASAGGYGALSGLYWLAALIPSIAVGVRRLHDTGRSGWWLLIALVPLIGIIVLIVFFIMEGNPGPNAYGPPAQRPGGPAPASA